MNDPILLIIDLIYLEIISLLIDYSLDLALVGNVIGLSKILVDWLLLPEISKSVKIDVVFELTDLILLSLLALALLVIPVLVMLIIVSLFLMILMTLLSLVLVLTAIMFVLVMLLIALLVIEILIVIFVL